MEIGKKQDFENVSQGVTHSVALHLFGECSFFVCFLRVCFLRVLYTICTYNLMLVCNLKAKVAVGIAVSWWS
jgi:hypothetical protein